MKRVFILLLILIFLIGGCGGEKGVITSPPASSSAAAGDTVPTIQTQPNVTAPLTETLNPTIPVPTETLKPIPTEPIPPTTSPPKINYPLYYEDETCSISINYEWYENAWCYIAHLQLTDYSRLATDCANGAYNRGYETTSHAARRLKAIFAVNGCYSAPYLNYPVVRNGVICNGAERSLYVPAIYNQNNGLLLSAWESGGAQGIVGVNLQELVDNNLITDTFCFGPPILNNGVIVCSQDSRRAQRTMIGTNGSPGDIYIIVSEGRYADGKSSGLTGYQCAQLMQSLGCTFGICLDGGGSSTMVFQGKVLNSARNNERAIVDFVFIKG